MKPWHETTFKRKFSIHFYKNLKLRLGEMSLAKDWATTARGDPYPNLLKKGSVQEKISSGTYWVRAEETARLLGQYFPYATYEVTVKELVGKCGFIFQNEETNVKITLSCQEGTWKASAADEKTEESFSIDEVEAKEMVFIVTCRKNQFDMYYKTDDFPVYVGSFTAEDLKEMDCYLNFSATVAGLYIAGRAQIKGVWFYLDCGISQADLRPIRYENGEPIIENGKVYLTASIRMQEECYQGVLSWTPGTSDFALVGAIFYDAGDGIWGNDVAASILFHRESKKWYIWMCSFCHGHVLGHGVCNGDLRFGINVVGITLMECMTAEKEDTRFLGKEGDEDPDFVYDENEKKWYLAICRIIEEQDEYRYFLFESENPFEGYRYVTHSLSGQETGGSIVKCESNWYFICGNGFSQKAQYRVYPLGDFSKFQLLSCDFSDGGFRGWGTVFAMPCGSYSKYMWLTFDRHNGSEYNWSYGNLYCYEANQLYNLEKETKE